MTRTSDAPIYRLSEEGLRSSDTPRYRLSEEGLWSQAWKIAAVFAVVGFAWIALAYEPRRFAFSYLFAFVTFLTLGLGALFFVLVHHLTAAGWGVAVRRTAEFFLMGLPIFVLLFIPIAQNTEHLYEWERLSHGAHEAHHDSHEGPVHETTSEHSVSEGKHASGPEAALHHELLEKKSPYLNRLFFLARAFAYFVVWAFLAWFYVRGSLQQDNTKEFQKWTVRFQSLSPVAMILFGFTSTFAAFDWVMSLEPTWYSTIFGVYFFAGSAIAILALLITVTAGLKNSGYLGDAVNIEHHHDLWKATLRIHLLLGIHRLFAVDVEFGNAGIPEEATYYHHRWVDVGWKRVSLLLMVAHFGIPFFFLMAQIVKRNASFIRFGAAWMLLMHVVDVYWLVMPYADQRGFSPDTLDFACLFAVGGAYLSVVLFSMRKFHLIPVGDPRLFRALNFHSV